jgi:hypothetical protein
MSSATAQKRTAKNSRVTAVGRSSWAAKAASMIDESARRRRSVSNAATA